VRDTTFKGGGKENINLTPVSEVPTQCPFLLPVEVNLKKSKILGSEKVNGRLKRRERK
jgi:hypothetical protein